MLGIRIKDYFIIDKENGKLLIINKDHEGKDFNKNDFYEVLDKFFKENYKKGEIC